MAKGRT